MSLAAADIAFACELFDDLGALTHRRMMGGLCLYADGQLFAILDSEAQIYLRSKGALADRLRAEGARQFGNTGYWSLPDAALDDPAIACDLARDALSEARG